MALFNFVKSALPILDVVTHYCQLKHVGNYWKGPCPFHSEKDASFTVSPNKQIFYCFGCQASGDVIAFIAKAENISQFEAVKYIIDRFKLDVPEDIKSAGFKNSQVQDTTSNYYRACEIVAQWAHDQLLHIKVPHDYLLARGITPTSMNHFKLGYFPGGLRSLNAFIQAMSKQHVLLNDLLEYGIVMEGKSIMYSPFEERILFPITDHIGRFCGFGGRIFKTADERAKYYNSRESEGFIKGKLLFGLDLAKKAMQKDETVFLVEGYMDCIAMVQHGFANTVATLGTACTPDHLKTLARYASTLYMIYDGDKAGRQAILRITEFCWQASLDLKVVQLPSNQDPASFLANKGDLVPLVEQAKDIFSFFIEAMGADFLRQPLAKKLHLADKMISVIASIDDAFKQDLLLQQASLVMQMPVQSLKDRLVALGHQEAKKGSFHRDQEEPAAAAWHDEEKNDTKKSQEEIIFIEEKIFSAIINNVDKADEFKVDPTLVPYFSSHIQGLLEKLTIFRERMGFSNAHFKEFLDSLDAHEHEWVMRVSLQFDAPISADAFNQLIIRFCKYNWKQIVRDIKQKILLAKQHKDHDTLKVLLSNFLKLKQGINDRGLI